MSSKILKNCIDIHVHSGPGLFPRTVDDFQLAQEALKAEMRAVVLKAHEGSTVFRAHLVNRSLGREILIGSIVLNSFVGGFNPDAVDCAVKLGARVVWMPTISAQNHLNHYGSCNYSNMNTNSEPRPLKPQRIFDEKGDIKPEVKEILEIIRDSDVCIATSHLSLEESLKLIDEALQMGIRKILLNHPEAGVTRVDLEIQKELAKRGVFIEKAYLWATARWKACSIDQLAYSIKHIGAASCVISTDLGSPGNPRPTEGFVEYINSLMSRNIDHRDIQKMASQNPVWLLGL